MNILRLNPSRSVIYLASGPCPSCRSLAVGHHFLTSKVLLIILNFFSILVNYLCYSLASQLGKSVCLLHIGPHLYDHPLYWLHLLRNLTLITLPVTRTSLPSSSVTLVLCSISSLISETSHPFSSLWLTHVLSTLFLILIHHTSPCSRNMAISWVFAVPS